MTDLLPHLLLHILFRSVTSEACIESKGIFCATCCQINPIRSLNLFRISWCHAWAIMNKVERWSLQNHNIISTKSFLSYLVYLCNCELLLHLIYIDERKETYGVSWNKGVSSHSDHIQGVSFILTQCWHCREKFMALSSALLLMFRSKNTVNILIKNILDAFIGGKDPW